LLPVCAFRALRGRNGELYANPSRSEQCSVDVRSRLSCPEARRGPGERAKKSNSKSLMQNRRLVFLNLLSLEPQQQLNRPNPSPSRPARPSEKSPTPSETLPSVEAAAAAENRKRSRRRGRRNGDDVLLTRTSSATTAILPSSLLLLRGQPKSLPSLLFRYRRNKECNCPLSESANFENE